MYDYEVEVTMCVEKEETTDDDKVVETIGRPNRNELSRIWAYRDKVLYLIRKWRTMTNNVEVIYPCVSEAVRLSRFHQCKEDLKIERSIWKKLDDLLEIETQKRKLLVNEARDRLREAFHDITEMHGVKGLLESDTEIPNDVKCIIQRSIERKLELEDEHQDSSDHLLIKGILNSETIPDDVKNYLEKFKLHEKPVKEEEKPEENSEEIKEKFQALIAKATASLSEWETSNSSYMASCFLQGHVESCLENTSRLCLFCTQPCCQDVEYGKGNVIISLKIDKGTVSSPGSKKRKREPCLDTRRKKRRITL